MTRIGRILASLVTSSAVVAAGLAAGAARAAVTLDAPEGPRVAYRTQRVENVDVFYREAGDPGRPTIVLLHGFPTSSQMFRELIPLLADRFHVIAPDYPGFGYSSAPDETQFAYTFEHLAEVMEGFLDALGVQRTLLYMQDYGGPVGFRLALRRPERVAGLVIQNANAYEEGLSAMVKDTSIPFWKARTPETEKPMRELLTLPMTKLQYLAGAQRPEAVNPDAWMLTQALLDRPGMDRIQLALLHDYRTNPPLYPAWQRYLRERQPRTLIVWGKGDPIFIAPGAEAYLRDLPKARLVWLNGGHFALEEYAWNVAREIKTFFDAP